MLLISKFNTVESASTLLEKDLKIKLPADYAKFLDKYNGGVTHKTYVKFNRKKDDIRAFFGFKVTQ